MLAASALAYITFPLMVLMAANAQTFVPNPGWRNTNIDVSTKDRIDIARDALNKAIAMIVDDSNGLKFEDGNYGPIGRLFSQMAQFDMLTKQTVYKERLLDFFPQAEKFRPGFVHSSINWGLSHSIAATQAFTAYSDPSFLEWAEQAWRGGEAYTLKEEELKTGRINGKNVTIRSECEGVSTAGGTFWNNKPEDPFVNALGTGSFLIASSVLSEATKNSTYALFASKSRDFYYNHLRNTRGDMLDGKHLNECQPSAGAYPANFGLVMEGLAVLTSVSGQENRNTYFSDLVEIVNRTVSNTEWHSQQGILSADLTARPFVELVGQYVVRGLAAIYDRNNTRSSLRTFVRQYLGVQYNAVRSNARGQGSSNDTYTVPWTSPQQPPSSQNATLETQINALSILLAAIPIQNDPPGEPEPSITPEPPKGTNRTTLDWRAIVGAVIGGLATVCLLTVFVLWLVRRRSRSRHFVNALDATLLPTEFANQSQTELFASINKHLHLGGPDGEKDRPPPSESGSGDLSGWSLTYLEDTDTGTDSSQAPLSMVSTAEIMSVLNRRLQGVEWPEDDPPPDYVSHNPPSSNRSTE
ncbi:hypothetical protein AAF712_000918 [Marasmius tenuissimus]|uniref:Glycoside hydrolase family 76 protein n=1 Tax=Marasmius tenuissimus TaxID=585030 RepID=A0ABR3AEU5_9AGAR